MTIETLLQVLKVFLFVSIFFVWVPRYSNIVEEFEKFNLPDPVRDLVGILKLFFSFSMIISDSSIITLLCSSGIAFLMVVAQFIHFRYKTDLIKRLPSLVLFIISITIFYYSS